MEENKSLITYNGMKLGVTISKSYWIYSWKQYKTNFNKKSRTKK